MSSALAVTLATDADDTVLFQMDKVGKCISCTFSCTTDGEYFRDLYKMIKCQNLKGCCTIMLVPQLCIGGD